jgi:predicted RNA-binding protein Jag
MKSIMEEASSISKAIDQAWQRAGNPMDFTIKILETPERNMFGLTVKSAKIAFFFDDYKASSTLHAKPAAPKEHKSSPPPLTPPERVVQKPRPLPAPPAAPMPRSHWDDEMVQIAQNWVQHALSKIGVADATFSTTVSSNGLTFRFKQSPTGNQMKDRLLFSSFAHLILTTLRQKFKKAFRHLKVILIIE